MINLSNHSIWIIDIRNFHNYIDDIKKCLSREEIEKSKKITIKQNKSLFCLRKGITRIILSSVLNMNPNEIKYRYNSYGKPFIHNEGYENFNFNISHSKEYLFVGITKDKNIGVDIEKINLKLNHHILAKSVFSSEEMKLYLEYNKVDQLHSFYKAWVQKEAISKALGLGISIGFNKISVNINPNFNDEEYEIRIDNLKYLVKVKNSVENNYFISTALV